MNKLAAVKLAVRIIAGAGTSTISASIIKNNVATDNLIQKISVAVSAVAIGSMASEAVKTHTDAKIDEFVALFQSHTSKETPTA